MLSLFIYKLFLLYETYAPYRKNKKAKMAGLPSLPPVLKPVQHYLKTAAEHDIRDPVVAYYCKYVMVK